MLAVTRDLAGSAADEETVKRCAASILGQCVFYYFAHPILLRLPLETLASKNIEGLTDHITRFSLQALQLSREIEP